MYRAHDDPRQAEDGRWAFGVRGADVQGRETAPIRNEKVRMGPS